MNITKEKSNIIGFGIGYDTKDKEILIHFFNKDITIKL
jgi:hypothetical protein